MRVAIVRGPHLNPYEMQTYEPLARMGHEVVAFASRHTLHAPSAAVRVTHLPSPTDRILGAKGPARRVREAYAYATGTIDALDGLEKALEGFDVVHAVETYHSFTRQSLDAAQAGGAPLVVTVWENIPHFPLAPKLDANRARVLREADAFIAVTERTRDALLLDGAPADRIHVIPVGVDLARFAPDPTSAQVRQEHGVPADAPLLVVAARLVWEKGLLDVLHAMKLNALRGHDRAHLLVVGEGPQRAEAEQRARALGLASRVRFAGSIPYDRMHRVFQAADGVVLASIPTPRWQEQYGMVLVEAMACGAPIVTTRSGSIPDVVGDAALLVQPNDPHEMSQALLEIEDASAREGLAKRSLDRARAKFDREIVARQIEALYRRLVRSR